MLAKIWNALYGYFAEDPRRFGALPVLGVIAIPLLHSLVIGLQGWAFTIEHGDPLQLLDKFRSHAWVFEHVPVYGSFFSWSLGAWVMIGTILTGIVGGCGIVVAGYYLIAFVATCYEIVT